MTEAQQCNSLTILDCGGMTVRSKRATYRLSCPNNLFVSDGSIGWAPVSDFSTDTDALEILGNNSWHDLESDSALK
jgi:hypothetical protein